MKKGIILLTAALVIGGVWLTGCTANEPPVIDSLEADTLVTQGKMVTITCTATDFDEDELFYTWEATGGDFADPTDESEIVWEEPYEAGSYTITCTVSDGNTENEVSDSVIITVQAQYFPRGVGYKWYYYDAFENLAGQDDTLFLDVEVLSGDESEGVWDVQRTFSSAIGGLTPEVDTIVYTISHDSIWIDDPKHESEYLGLVQPLWEGKTWDTGEGGTGTVVDLADVTVPDGEYTACFNVIISGGDIERDMWFAPVVGMISTEVTVADTMDFQLELAEHEF